MSRWQHSSTKCAPLAPACAVSTPLLARMPTSKPSMRAKPHTRVSPCNLLELLEAAAVHQTGDDLAAIDAGLVADAHQAGKFLRVVLRRLDRGRCPAQTRRLAEVGDDAARDLQAWASSSARWSVTPLTRLCISAPPSGSMSTTSPVAANTSCGLPRNIAPRLRMMTTSSHSAGM